jgi:hypothetical protein
MLGVAVACAAWSLTGVNVVAKDLSKESDEHCAECREAEEEAGLIHGELVAISPEQKTMQVQIGADTEVLVFDDTTALRNAAAIEEIPKRASLKILYLKKGGKILAREVEVKKSIKAPSAQLASVEEVAKLVSLGPEQTKYVLLDGRPVNWYCAGHIPTAKAMPIWLFDDLKDKLLPEDKKVLQIYYCSGFG